MITINTDKEFVGNDEKGHSPEAFSPITDIIDSTNRRERTTEEIVEDCFNRFHDVFTALSDK